MRGSVHFGYPTDIVPVITAGLTIALLVYTIQIAKLNEIRVINGARTNQILSRLEDKLKGKKE